MSPLTWTLFPWTPGLIRIGIPFFFQMTSKGRSPSATVQMTRSRLPWVRFAGNVNFSTNGATIKYFSCAQRSIFGNFCGGGAFQISKRKIIYSMCAVWQIFGMCANYFRDEKLNHDTRTKMRCWWWWRVMGWSECMKIEKNEVCVLKIIKGCKNFNWCWKLCA